MQWVVADTTYGNSADLRNFIHKQQRCYIMEVPQTLHVRFAVEHNTQTVNELAASLETQAWKRLAFDCGEKSLTFYDWAAIRVAPTTDGVGEQWLLRRNLENGEITYYLSNASAETPLEILAEIASSRWRIEQMLEEAKGEAGLAEYEVRAYPSWYRHITLSMVAHTWLTLVRHEEREKKPPACLDEQQFCRTAALAECSLSVEVVDLATKETSTGYSVSLLSTFPAEYIPSLDYADEVVALCAGL